MLLETIGIGLIVGSCGSIISSLSFSSLSLKQTLQQTFRIMQLGIKNGDTLMIPTINHQADYKWGTRLLLGLPAGLHSEKVIEQAGAISEALRADVEVYYKDGLIIDVYKGKMADSVPYEFQPRHDWKIPIGINRRGEIRFYDFAGSFPHLLIGGISGGGKSVLLRAILTSLSLNTSKPELYLCDLKGGVELGLFKDLVFTKEFASTLPQALEIVKKAEIEMNTRYDIMAKNGSQEWKGTRIIFIMDELADLKTRTGDPDNVTKMAIKTKLTAISAKGRAAGVILVLATQRPSADVVDGLIKTNIATSICFRTRDSVQSRIVLDSEAAAHLPDLAGRCIFQQAHDETLQTFYLPYEQAKQLLSQVERKAETHEPGPAKSLPMDGNTLELG